MRLRVNGMEKNIDNVTNVAEIVKALGYEGEFFAVALNRACVPRRKYAAVTVQENDEIEILSPMQGG